MSNPYYGKCIAKHNKQHYVAIYNTLIRTVSGLVCTRVYVHMCNVCLWVHMHTYNLLSCVCVFVRSLYT